MRSLPFLFKEAFINLRRHGLMTAAAITTIAVALALMAAFGITFYQINTATHRAASDFEVRVFCRQEDTPAQLSRIRRRLEHIQGVITPVPYISAKDAYREQTKNLPIDLTGIPNQFNPTFVVRFADPKRAQKVVAFIRSWHDVVQEVSVPDQEMDSVMQVSSFIRLAGMIGGAILLFGALVVVSNTVRVSLFARRREIRIMQIVGATPAFIRLPLFIEGVVHGLAGGLLASVCILLVARNINGFIAQSMPWLARYFDFTLNMLLVSGAIAAAGTLIGASGSLVTIRRDMPRTITVK